MNNKPEENIIKPEKRYEDGLIKFFEDRGYENVREADGKNFNHILYATKDGQECFIKKYVSRHGKKETIFAKANTEMLCYENLPKEYLLDVVEINMDEHYLVLKKEELQKIEIDEQYVNDFTDMGLNKFLEIDASFLPETSWDYYEGRFEYLKEIERAGFIDNADEVIALFRSRKELIESAKQIFSHQDFGHTNVKKAKGQIKMFDFEISRRDNAMYDMACVYIDIKDNEKLKKLFNEKVGESDLYNKELLDLMVVRRAIAVMNARLSKLHAKEDKYFKRCRDVFQEKVDELLR